METSPIGYKMPTYMLLVTDSVPSPHDLFGPSARPFLHVYQIFARLMTCSCNPAIDLPSTAGRISRYSKTDQNSAIDEPKTCLNPFILYVC
jgi:hypothetical protein